jgi:hypothetical protein
VTLLGGYCPATDGPADDANTLPLRVAATAAAATVDAATAVAATRLPRDRADSSMLYPFVCGALFR